MPGEYAPAAIRQLFDRLDELAPELGLELSGIVGDPAHTYGYHRARNVLPAGDYSRQLPDDQAGDGWAASALDVKPRDSVGMVALTRRLIAATVAGDPRLRPLREFFGTVNGISVTGRDVRTGRAVTSDGSHLWHVHLSIFRRYANDAEALAGVADVMAGEPLEEEFTMDAAAQKAFADLTDAVVDLRRFLSAVLTADDPTNPTDEAGQRSVYTVNRYALHPTESMIRGIAGDVDELRQLVETIAAAPKPAATSSSTAKAPAKAPSKPPAAP